MPKLRQRYRAPVEGEKIAVSEATYQKLRTVARANHCTIGQWAESNLRHYLGIELNVPMQTTITRTVSASRPTKERSFAISEGTLDEIDRFATPKGRTARQWIAATVLYCLDIELERLRGVKEQPDRFN